MAHKRQLVFILSCVAVSKLTIALISLHVIAVIYSISLLAATVKLKISYGDYVNMVTRSDGLILPLLSAVVGLLSLPLGTYGLFLSIKASILHKQPTRNVLILLYILATCVVAICNMSAVITAAVHAYQVQGKLHDGIVSAMEKYGASVDDKVTVDTLQIKFKCCGSKTFRDWFRIAWIDPTLGGVPSRKDFVSDDVPFSCCSGGPMFPCIHHGILSASNIYRYDPQRQLSVTTVGCHDVLVSLTKRMVHYIAAVMITFSFLQIVIGLMMRIVQTALSKESLRNARKKGKHLAWIFGPSRFIPRRRRRSVPLEQSGTSSTDSEAPNRKVKRNDKRKVRWHKLPSSDSC